ncbi:hypothetical protein CVT25_013825 [Psilocybe cyanescens]|uniref:SP-RING-type domain-containing protein n=1 Tax=Psilocybe cyanescens TaxID=93625 RepID=A0A409XFR9_PSICY|nr:hypothetical protein CVT25_013825 [Psilocybe cyanescens]
MPVATSSRRKQNSRRQNSEDIEDVRNTQTDGNIDEVSEEDRPRITNKVIVKKEHRRRSNGKQRADPEDDDGDDEDNDEDENDDDRINVQDFPDQPLRKDDMNKLKGFATDWISMRDRISKKWEIYRDVGVAMAEAGEKDMYSSKELQKLDRDMREFIDVTAEMTAHGESLDSIYQQVVAGEEIKNSLEVYRNGVEQRKNDYAGKTTRQKYEGDDSDSDDDLEMGGVTQNYNCPITLTRLVDPYTSRVCNHSFSADSINDHFKSGPPLKKCPAAGCNKSFKLSDCQPDKQLAKKVANYVRHLAVHAEDSDAEEVID